MSRVEYLCVTPDGSLEIWSKVTIAIAGVSTIVWECQTNYTPSIDFGQYTTGYYSVDAPHFMSREIIDQW